jgi:uncharacterized RDD family membrane protein YckC
MVPASPLQRAAAFVFDATIFASWVGGWTILGWLAFGREPFSFIVSRSLVHVWFPPGVPQGAFLGIGSYAVYHFITETNSGQSLGKRFTGIRVVDSRSGHPISIGQSFLRCLMLVLGMFTLFIAPLIAILVDDRRQRLGDTAADTLVIQADPVQPVDAITVTAPAKWVITPGMRALVPVADLVPAGTAWAKLAGSSAPTGSPALQPAGVLRRGWAACLDAAFQFSVSVIAVLTVTRMNGDPIFEKSRSLVRESDGLYIVETWGPSSSASWVLWLLWIPWLVYWFWAETHSGQTLGKRLAGLRVVREDTGGRISLGQAITRALFLAIGALGLYIPTLITMLVSERNQRLGDKVAGTMVVRNLRRAPTFAAMQQTMPAR